MNECGTQSLENSVYHSRSSAQLPGTRPESVPKHDELLELERVPRRWCWGRVVPLATTGEMIGAGATHPPTTSASNIPPPSHPSAHGLTALRLRARLEQHTAQTCLWMDGTAATVCPERTTMIRIDDPNHPLTPRGRQHAMHARRSSFFRPARSVCGIGRAQNMVQHPKNGPRSGSTPSSP